ncbi:MAG TPA: CheR family methyltransferase [Chloroflexaceae bacterium]|nr:CheR family methyltransferase [Chloroflexaceae bacterium]
MSRAAPEQPLAPQQMLALRDLLAAYCGVYLDDTRSGALEAAAQLRARARGLSPAAYAVALVRDRAELQRLSELLLNHETQFFRNRPHMQALREVVLPELHRRLPPGAPLRLWSAGCATGEEPYSLAIAALEALGERPGRPVEVWATDLSAAALEKARAAVYKGRSLANLTPGQRARYFAPRDDGLAVGGPVRALVRFEQLNLLEPFPQAASGVHVIFCQNVTIYFQVSTCRALMERFYHALAPGGSLFLGFSETLWNIFDRFRWREVAGSFVYYKDSQPAGAPSPTAARGRPGATASLAQPGLLPRPTRPLARPDPEPRSEATAELVARGRALLDAGQADGALDLFAGAPLAGAHAPRILALSARAHADRGELDLAAAEARRALELNPLTTEAHLLIGLIYARQGRHAAAVTQLERARYLDGASPLISFHLAEGYRQAGRAEDALREYRNTLGKLAAVPPDELLEGVAAGWLGETCRRYVANLEARGQAQRG